MSEESVNMFEQLKEELSCEDKEVVLSEYLDGKGLESISKNVDKKIEIVKEYIKNYEETKKYEIKANNTDIIDAKNELKKEINIVDNLHFVMGKLKGLVDQLENEDEFGIKKANINTLKPYLDTLKNFTDVTQWMADRRIKLEELIENKIYKQAIMEELQAESPEFRKRVLNRIKNLKKQQDLLS